MEFITKLDLKVDKNLEHYQCIYSSQLYGTFFSLYALVDAKLSPDKKFYNLDGIDLKIINYKGIVNIGIIGAELIDTVVSVNEDGSKVTERSLLVGVKAMAENPKDFPVELNIKNQEFHIGSKILVERFLQPMHENSSEKDGVFDSEIFYREGIYDQDSPVKRKGYEIRLWDNRPKKGNYTAPAIETRENAPAVGAGGWICPFMTLILI